MVIVWLILYSVYVVLSVCCTPCILYSLCTVLGVCCIQCMLYLVYAVLGVYCTWCILYLVYAVLGVCCTQCMLYSMYAVISIHCSWCILWLAYAMLVVCCTQSYLTMMPWWYRERWLNLVFSGDGWVEDEMKRGRIMMGPIWRIWLDLGTQRYQLPYRVWIHCIHIPTCHIGNGKLTCTCNSLIS